MQQHQKSLTTREAAERIGLSPNTLTIWRSRGVSHQPPYVKAGRKVVYLIDDLDGWVQANRVDSFEGGKA